MHESMGMKKSAGLGIKMPKSGRPSDKKEALWLAAFEREDVARVSSR